MSVDVRSRIGVVSQQSQPTGINQHDTAILFYENDSECNTYIAMLKLFQPDYCTPAIGLQAPFIRRPHVSSTGPVQLVLKSADKPAEAVLS